MAAVSVYTDCDQPLRRECIQIAERVSQNAAMHFDFVFILTYGRSGSTLLQGILNSIDGVCIRGENQAALRFLFKSYDAIDQARSRFGARSDLPVHAWYGIGNADVDAYGRDLASAFVRNVLRPADGVRVTGFKEVRYMPWMSNEEFAGFVDFVRRFFARAALIVNTRNIEAVIASNARAGHAVTQDQLRASDTTLREFAARGHSDVCHVHYDDYVSDPSRLQPLFDFLGVPLNHTRVQAVLDKKHSG